MVKKLKFITLALVGSTVALSVGIGWPTYSPAPKQAQHVTATPSAFNPIQDALLMHVSHEAHLLMERTSDPTLTERLIVAQNYVWMSVLDPAQQVANLKWIEIDKYRPGPGPWNRVREAPSRVKAILTLTPDQKKWFAAAAAEAAREQKKKWAFLDGLSREEAIRRQREFQARKTRAEHLADTSARLAREQAKIRSILTASQRQEWDEILALTKREYRKAWGTGEPVISNFEPIY